MTVTKWIIFIMFHLWHIKNTKGLNYHKLPIQGWGWHGIIIPSWGDLLTFLTGTVFRAITVETRNYAHVLRNAGFYEILCCLWEIMLRLWDMWGESWRDPRFVKDLIDWLMCMLTSTENELWADLCGFDGPVWISNDFEVSWKGGNP